MHDITEFKCPSCGGRMEFDPALQKMKCPFCDSVFDLPKEQPSQEAAEALSGEETVFQQGEEQLELQAEGWAAGEDANMRIYGCKSCGAQIIADATTGATSCPYCGNVVVMQGQFSGDLRPDLVIPFRISKEQAIEQFKKHINSQKYVPDVFSAQGHPEEIKGVYVPFWLFSADAKADMTFDAQQINCWSDSEYEYTETEYYRLRRAGTVRMENVPVDGSSKMEDELSESIEPYDASAAVPFTTAYLAGYLADRYDVDYTACKPRAQERMRRTAEQSMRASISNYVAVTTAESHLTWDKAEVRYALYPVWMLSTTWEGKPHLFAMNGQTGKFVGNLPLDQKKFSRARIKFGFVFAALMFVVLLILSVSGSYL